MYSKLLLKEILNMWLTAHKGVTPVLDYMRYKQLNWYGHVHRMDQERLPRRILEWCPPGRRRKGRPRNSRKQEVTTGMRERGIGGLEWVGREA